MTTAAHIAIGLVIAKTFNNYTPSQYDSGFVYTSSVFFSVLPDLNILWHRNISTHHKDFFHYPLLWLLIGLITILINQFLGLLFTINLVVHFLMDTLGWTTGIYWLMPWNNNEFSFAPLQKERVNYSLKQRITTYIKQGRFLIELAVIVLAIAYLVI